MGASDSQQRGHEVRADEVVPWILARESHGHLDADAVAQDEIGVAQHAMVGRVAPRHVQGVRVGEHHLVRAPVLDHVTHAPDALVARAEREGHAEHGDRLVTPLPRVWRPRCDRLVCRCTRRHLRHAS